MRYEVVRLAQFLFAILVIGGAFGAGVMFGWARWGINSSPVPKRSAAAPETRHDLRRGSETQHDEPRLGRVAPANLFAPEPSPAKAVVVHVEEAIDLRGPEVAVRSGVGPLALGHAIEQGPAMPGPVDPA